MKSIILRSMLAIIFIAVAAGRTLAYDHDSSGWFDSHHHHHAFTHHNGHRGYWDHDKGGAKIFITV
jgi:hypothetical protein